MGRSYPHFLLEVNYFSFCQISYAILALWSAIPHLTRLCEAAGLVWSARASAKFHKITRKALAEGRWEIADQTVGLSAWIESELAEGLALAREKNAHLPPWTAMWEKATLRREVANAEEGSPGWRIAAAGPGW